MRRASSYPTFLGDIFNYVNQESVSHFRPTSFKDILFKYRFELYDYCCTFRITIACFSYSMCIEGKSYRPCVQKLLIH